MYNEHKKIFIIRAGFTVTVDPGAIKTLRPVSVKTNLGYDNLLLFI
jgi:hypothetical protein